MSKPLMSYSRMSRLSLCGEQARQVYVLGRRPPPGTSMILGSAVDKAAAAALMARAAASPIKIDDLAILARRHVMEAFRSPVRLTPDEQALGIDAASQALADEADGLIRLWAAEVMPRRNPAMVPDTASAAGGQILGVQWRFVCELSECSHDLLGFVDLVEELPGGGLAVRDLKVVGRSPSEGGDDAESDADQSEQLSVYALAAQVWTGRALSLVGLDVLVRGRPASVDSAGRKRKAVEPKFVELVGTRTVADMEAALNRIAAAIKAYDAGVFVPASRDAWVCSERWCEFAADRTCPHFSSRLGRARPQIIQPSSVVPSVPSSSSQEASHVSQPDGPAVPARISAAAARVIGPGSPEWAAVAGEKT